MNHSGQVPTLAKIVTAARAGSLDHASALFRAGGYDRAMDDPAALAVAGRLAKDRALRAPPADRAALMHQAAQAYARAFAIDPQPYTRINEATLTLLAGDGARGQALARDLLDWLDSGVPFAETPYWLAATRAEAHLLLDDRPQAEANLARAVALAADSREDQATTVRQLCLILTQAGADSAWLDPYRPPRALNYAGHLGVAEAQIASLAGRVRDVLVDHAIGAGFGALAAGADLVIAGALLDHGAELHVVLPTAPATFIEQSVAPYGPHWLAQFERASAEAASLRWVSSVSGAYEPLATNLSADVAMGASVLHARRMASEAVQLLVIDDGDGPYGRGRDTAYLGERWRGGPPPDPMRHDRHRQQVCLVAPRSAAVAPSGAKPPEGRADRCLTAMLHIAFEGLDQLDDAGFAQALDTVIAPFREAADRILPRPDVVLPSGNARIVAFFDPDAAWQYAAALLALPEAAGLVRIAGHYGLAHWLGEPRALVGTSVSALAALAPAALPGVVTATETLASAIFVNQADAVHAEEIGEWRGDRLFALTPDVGTLAGQDAEASCQ
ncbi:TRAFs-binding domain-containing protein [Novosphingobium lentum]|uniref:TRAFs-binding domain-containing protein n=1 Tax=Novosphingobium lentum TaxID=145287 RepID=UPI00082AB867|nr:TRAFs-binding domain-containing protein [Novosphingobium lentum]